MTTQLLTGLGRPDFTLIQGLFPKFLHVEPLAFSISGDSKKEESFKFVDGLRKRAGSKIIEELYMLKVEIEAASWTAIQFALGKASTNVPSINLPEVRYANIPTAGNTEIVDPDLGAALGVQVFVTESGTWGDEGALSVLATGNPAAGQFKVDQDSNKIIFNAAQAGATVAYRLIKTFTNLDAIGVDRVAQALTQFSFSGLSYTDSGEFYKIIIPKMNRAKVVSLALGEKTKFEIEFDLAVAAGQTSEYQMIRMPLSYQP